MLERDVTNEETKSALISNLYPHTDLTCSWLVTDLARHATDEGLLDLLDLSKLGDYAL